MAQLALRLEENVPGDYFVRPIRLTRAEMRKSLETCVVWMRQR